MLPLTTTSAKMQVVTDAAASVDVCSAWVEKNQSTQAITAEGMTTANIATATTQDNIPGPPASGITRNVRQMTIRNKHASQTVNVTVLYHDGTNAREIKSSSLAPGEELHYQEGVNWFEYESAAIVDLIKALSSNDTGSNGTSAQAWFPTAGGVTVTGDTTYRMEGTLHLIRSAGTTSHTTSLLFGGTATLTSIRYRAYCNTGDVATNLAVNQTTMSVATATVVKAASTSATEEIIVSVDGIVRINAAGTFIPQYQYSVAPGGAPTVQANSFFKLTRIGSGSFVAQGTWA